MDLETRRERREAFSVTLFGNTVCTGRYLFPAERERETVQILCKNRKDKIYTGTEGTQFIPVLLSLSLLTG